MQSSNIKAISLKLHKNMQILAGIFLLSLCLRLVYLYQLKSTPLFGFFTSDSYFYDQFALKILQGNILFKEAVYLSLLYPFFLSLIYIIFGHSLTAVALCQIILDSLSCVFLYLICIKLFNKRAVGLLASFVYACYGPAIFYTGFLLDTSLVAFLNITLILCILYAKAKKSSILWLLSGVIISLSMLLKTIIILFLPLLVLWFFYNHEKKKKMIDLALIFTGILVVIIPFSIRSYMIEKRFFPMSVTAGLNFYIGNNPSANGTYTSIKGISDMPIDLVKTSIARASRETGEDLTPSEASGYWFLKGLRFIRGNPKRYALLIVRKFFLFWNNEEIASNVNYYFCKRFLPLINFTFFSFGVIAPFAVLGVIFAVRERLAGVYLIILFVLYYMGALLLYFVTSRFRFPITPFIIVLGAYGLHSLALLLKSAGKRELVLFSILLLFFFLITNKGTAVINSKTNFSVSHYALGSVYLEKGLLNEAITEYQRAIKIDPEYAEARFSLGRLYYQKGLLEEAITEYKKSIEIEPEHVGAHNNLGNLYYQKGLPEEAITEYQKAIEIDAEYAEAHINLGNLYYQKGLLEEAITEYQRAIKIDPEYAEAHFNLASIYDAKGWYEEAIKEYKEALRLDPYFTAAYNNLGYLYVERDIDFDEGIRLIKRALSLEPENAEIMDSLGWAYYKKGMLDDALEQLKKAAFLLPDNAEIYNHLADVYQEMGLEREAGEAGKKASD